MKGSFFVFLTNLSYQCRVCKTVVALALTVIDALARRRVTLPTFELVVGGLRQNQFPVWAQSPILSGCLGARKRSDEVEKNIKVRQKCENKAA